MMMGPLLPVSPGGVCSFSEPLALKLLYLFIHSFINEDTTKLRFRIRIQSQKISKEDQVRYFPWREDKAAALKEAEAGREHMIHKYL